MLRHSGMTDSRLEDPMRAVVFHQGALGDFLLALRAVDGIWRALPRLRIVFWTKPEHLSLAARHPAFSCGRSLDGPLIPSLLHDELWRDVPIPEFLRAADRVMIFGQSGTRILAKRLAEKIGGRVDWIRSFPAEGEGTEHAADLLRKVLTSLGWPVTDGRGPLIVPPGDALALKNPPFDENARRPVILHPGSGGRRKIWPLQNWRSLAGWMRGNIPEPVLLSVGPADECLDDFARDMSRAGIPVLRGLTLLQTAALLAKSSLYIGSDSGVSHLAASVGAPTVAVFGPTDPNVWGPRGDMVRIVRKSWSESDTFACSPNPKPPDPELLQIVLEFFNR
ncbi:MAG: glycosyltransferase family 9 protein [Desulfobacteraceae bacterium]|nr:glycosyltransferase family 9 protein [Desulfobacteraceae bacterium]